MVVVPENLKRTCTAALIFTAQQATGATAFAYYGPQYFKLLVGNKGDSDLLLTAIFGAIKVAACSIFVLFIAERVPRKLILVIGAFCMAAFQIIAAAVLKTHPAQGDGVVTGAGIATIAMIYLVRYHPHIHVSAFRTLTYTQFVIFYNFSWGPLPWPYVSEIFPTRIREPGIAVGVSSQWLFNFVFSISTPYMIKNLGWGTFLLWGIFDLVIGVGCWLLLKETRGLSLEQITHTSDSAKLFDQDREFDGDRRVDNKTPEVGVEH